MSEPKPIGAPDGCNCYCLGCTLNCPHNHEVAIAAKYRGVTPEQIVVEE